MEEQRARRKYVREITRADLDNPSPVYCVWEITLACDLGCKHCGSRAGKARPDELTTQQCLDVVAELDELGVREVTLIGGEAYLRDDWDQIAAEITRRGMSCSITTGARNLTQDRIDRAVAAAQDPRGPRNASCVRSSPSIEIEIARIPAATARSMRS